MPENSKQTKRLVLTALLGAISALLMILEFPIPLVPPFIKMDFSELPVILGGFILGPAGGALVALVKVALSVLMRGTDTAFIGEIANLTYSLGYMLPAVLIYRIKNKERCCNKPFYRHSDYKYYSSYYEYFCYFSTVCKTYRT